VLRSDPRKSGLLTCRSLLCGCATVPIATGQQVFEFAAYGRDFLFNDFYLYWGSAKLLALGHDPYDLAMMTAILKEAGLHPVMGLGYSYPLLLLYLMLPLTLLPPFTAGLVFSGLSLIALAFAVALLMAPLSRLPWSELALLTLGAATFFPVTGTLRFGQANLLLLFPLALALRGVAGPIALAAASAIKLYPVAGFIAYLAHGRHGWRSLWLGGLAFVALSLAPNMISGHRAGHLVEMFTPDAYWTNESLTGFISRLAGGPWHTAPPLVPDLPVEPVAFAVTALLGCAAVAAVLAVRGHPWDGCLALLIAYATLAAPRNSAWNFCSLLLAFAWCWPQARRRPIPLAILLAGWLMIQFQSQVYEAGPGLQQTARIGLLGSVTLYGALLVTALTAYLLLERRRAGSG
jgi:Glycosyltransferase family 87